MAHLLNAEGLVVVHAARRLLDGVSLGLDGGDRVGVVGRNGDGKSTLLRLLAGIQTPDGGRVTRAGGVRLGLLAQHDELDPDLSVRRTVLGDAADHAWAGEAGVRDVVAALLGGLDAAGVGGLGARIGHLSGGQRRRVGLAALLARDDDVLLLDEPTNHLDVEGVAWLAAHLRGRWPAGRGALVVVTHDRWFLDEVALRTWEVHGGGVNAYDGGYAAYVLAREERARLAAAAEQRRAGLLRKELAWLRRGPPARTSKPRFRLDAAAALVADEPPPRDSVALQRMATARLGRDVLDLEDVAVELGGRRLLDGVTWRLGPGDRFAVIGANGAGKTTLLRVLAGTLRVDAGVVRRGVTVRPAMLGQEVAELDEVAGLRVHEAVEKVRGVVRIGDRELTAGQLLERLGFTRARVDTPVSELSGGERRRLQLLRLLMAEPNVLLLDEPTNDLDTDTLAAVEDALDGWPGTMVVVSHDRYLLERVTDRQVALLGDGTLRDLPGGVEEYLALRRALAEPAARPGPARPPPAPGGTAREARREMARIERRLDRLAEQESRLHAALADQASDHIAVVALDAELRGVLDARERLELAWLAAAEVAG